MTDANDPINSIPDLNEHPSSWYGLTKREYFAAMALQGLLANASHSRNPIHAHDAVQFADAIIKALNESK